MNVKRRPHRRSGKRPTGRRDGNRPTMTDQATEPPYTRGFRWVPKNPRGEIDPSGGRPFNLNRWHPAIPLLLMPVRLETRFVNDTDPAELRIRILPDPATVAGAAPASAREIEEAQVFWTQYHAASGAEQRTATWRQYVRRLGSQRAGYVARLTRPAIGTDGNITFAAIDPAADGQALAALLPDRWLATGWVGEKVAFQAFSRQVSGPLTTSPDPAAPAAPIPDSGLVIDPATAWLFDYQAAVRRGMAITVPLTGRAEFAADGVSTLVVVGVNEARAPASAAKEISALFEQHSRSAGLAFVPQGTPTNNTATVEAGYRRQEAELADLEARELGVYRAHAHDNASRFTQALGLSNPDMFGRLAHGADREYGRSRDMRIALFETVLGTYLSQLLATHANDSEILGGGLDRTTIQTIRRWFTDWVTGGAPLPSLRIGRQPYGILPVMSRAHATFSDPFKQQLAVVIDVMLQEWRAALAAVPVLDHNVTDTVNADTELSEAESRDRVTAVLANNPHPRRLVIRTAVDWADQEPLGGVQARVAAPVGEHMIDLGDDGRLFDPILVQIAGGFRWTYHQSIDLLNTRYEQTVKALYNEALQQIVPPRPEFDDIPVDPPIGGITGRRVPSTDDDIRDIEQQIQIWTQVDASIDNGFAIAIELAEFFDEFHAFAQDVIAQLERHELRQRPFRWLSIPGLEGVLGRDELQLLLTRFNTFERLWSRAVVQDTKPAEGLAAADYLLDLSGRFGSPPIVPPPMPAEAPLLYQLIEATRPQGGDRAARQESLRRLAAVDPDALEWLLRETLGLGSHRLDAWHTSLASERLATLRDANPEGLYVGSFGFVLDLVPTDDRPSHGFIHAPSLSHAATAAVLRSGWLARGNNDNASPAAVDLTSRRIRDADWYLSGVRNGQDLGDLLGAQFERALHDARLDAAIRPLRLAVAAADGLGEGAADQPVDGIRLLDLYRDDQLDDAVAALGLPPKPKGLLRRLLDALASAFDAIDDATTFEMVHQLVVGNLDRAAAVVDGMGPTGGRPPELMGVRTPRGALTIDTRALVLIEANSGTDPGGWHSGLRDRFDPALDSWVASLLPAPSDIGWVGLSAEGEEISLHLGNVAVSALDALFVAHDDPRSVTPALRRLTELAYPDHVFSAFRPAVGGGASTTLAEFQLLAVEVRRLIQESTPADDRALAGAEAALIQRNNPDATITAAEAVLAALFDLFTTVGEATAWSALTPAQMVSLARIGLTPSPTADPVSDFTELQQRVARRRERADAVEAADSIDGMRTRVAQVIGAAAPLLAPFRMPADHAVVFSGSLASVDEIDDWFESVGHVRPAVAALTRVIHFSGLLGLPPPTMAAGQLPLLDGDAWAALHRPAPSTGGRLAVAAVTHGPVAPTQPVVGLLVDQWAERIPLDDQVTGLTMHFDGPSTEAPQTMLLMVPPEGGKWSSDLILDTLLETIEWAQLRTVAIDDLGDFGHAVPTTVVPGELAADAKQGGTS